MNWIYFVAGAFVFLPVAICLRDSNVTAVTAGETKLLLDHHAKANSEHKIDKVNSRMTAGKCIPFHVFASFLHKK